MIISDKQHDANLRNALHSTGPKTEEGKEAVRFNALKHGLRAEATLVRDENPEQLNELCTELENYWNPQNKIESLLVEQMAVHQWHLRRLALGERRVFASGLFTMKDQLSLVERYSALRTRLENSYAKTMKDLIQIQKTRPTAAALPEPKVPKVHAPVSERPPAESPSPGHVYVAQPQTP